MELLVFTDNEYRSMASNVLNWKQKITMLIRRTIRLIGVKYLSSLKIIIFYDGWCPLCRGIVKKLNGMDYLNLMICLDFRDLRTVEEYKLVLDEVQLRMHSKKIDQEKLDKGIDSIVQISFRLVPL